MRRIIGNVVRKIFGRRKASAARRAEPPPPVIVRREEHTISRSRLDENALKVLNRLARHNYTAFLVGGGVRDLLLDRPVKDFDIATSAHPNEIKQLFRNCRLIGRRFRLAHILFKGGTVIEVSTFRRQAGFSDEGDLLIRSDNTFGTPEEDARRRDFTINGLFYSITDFSVIDYVGGLEDLEARLIRTIGDPGIRFQEDPVRILRGIRLAARLGLAIEPATRRAMGEHREAIWKCAAPRVLEEFVRMLNQGAASASFPLLAHVGVLEGMLPGFAAAYAKPAIRAEVDRDLAALDAHVKPRTGLTAGLALAVLYYPLLHDGLEAASADADRVRLAAELLEADLGRLSFPRGQMDRAVTLLAAQQRLARQGTSRQRPAALAARGWFPDALTLFEITQGDTPEGRATLRRWRTLREQVAGTARDAAVGEAGTGAEHPGRDGDEPADGRPRGKRRRRRGGRGRKRRTAADSPGTDAEPTETDAG